MLYRPNTGTLCIWLCIVLCLTSCTKPVETVQELEEPLEVHDIMMPESPKQNVSGPPNKTIDEETELEQQLDDTIEETIEEVPVEEESLAYVGEAESGYENASSTEYYANDFQSAGVIYGDDGTKYTWYSQNVLPGGGLTDLNENGRTVDERGFVVDGDGYIAVSSSDYGQGSIIDTPFGQAKVYDTGCDSGVIDVYTDF